MSKPKLLALQVGIGPESYPFLSHNSFLDCSNIIKISKCDLESDLADGTASYKGRLDDEDLDFAFCMIL